MTSREISWDSQSNTAFNIDLGAFRSEISEAMTRVETLNENRGSKNGKSRHLDEALSELEKELEELQVAHEELRIQNESLIISAERLNLERLRYRELFDKAPEAYITTDPNGKILEANRAACGILNVESKFLCMKVLASLVPMDHRKSFRVQLNNIKNSNTSGEVSLYLQPRKANEPLHFSASATPLRYRGDDLVEIRWALTATSRDDSHSAKISETSVFESNGQHFDSIPLVSDSERSDAWQIPEPVLGELVYITCRSIQEPIHNIIGLTELIKEQAAEFGIPEIEADSASIGSRASQIDMLVTELVDLIRIDSGWSKPVVEKISLSEFISEVEVGVQYTLNDAGFEITNSIDPAGLFLYGNRVRLWRAMVKTLVIANDISDNVSLETVLCDKHLWFCISCKNSVEPRDVKSASNHDAIVDQGAAIKPDNARGDSRAIYRLMFIQRLFERLNVQFRMEPCHSGNSTGIRIGFAVME